MEKKIQNNQKITFGKLNENVHLAKKINTFIRVSRSQRYVLGLGLVS